MIFPLDLLELGMLFAVTALVLLVASELLSPYNRRINMLINRKKLKRAAIVFSLLFIATVAIRIFSLI